MASKSSQGSASALPIIHEKNRTFRWYEYTDQGEPNPGFDGAAFVKSWARFVGSAHRYYRTGTLVLCWSTEGPHAQERERLRAELEAQPGNVAAVLAAIDKRDDDWDRTIQQANARFAELTDEERKAIFRQVEQGEARP